MKSSKLECAIAIFAKTPGLSPVKTRLAKDVGSELALEIYEHSINAVLELLLAAQKELSFHKIDLYLFLGEESGRTNPFWKNWESKITLEWSGEGDLGDRLSYVYQKLYRKYENVILMGTDSPQIQLGDLINYIETCFTNMADVTIGPAKDGGFYFFKSSMLINKKIWTSVQYSQENTLCKLIAELARENINVGSLPEELDIDDLDSLKLVIDRLRKISSPLPAQERLNQFLDNDRLA